MIGRTCCFALWAGVVVVRAFAGEWVSVDLSGGRDAASWPVRERETGPALSNDACRTTELWFRQLPGTNLLVAVFETTQEQYFRVTGERPARHAGAGRPVESVSWRDVRTNFLSRLSARTGLTCELPTEAEWMYACRAGVRGSFHNGKWSRSHEEHWLDGIARYANNRHDGRGGGYEQHCIVGSYAPNAWGLHDFHGNVSEMCLEHLEGRFPWNKYLKLKGGNWYPCMETSTAMFCSVDDRGCGAYLYADEDYASDMVGFRVFARRTEENRK